MWFVISLRKKEVRGNLIILKKKKKENLKLWGLIFNNVLN